jgi:hypothetical protein
MLAVLLVSSIVSYGYQMEAYGWKLLSTIWFLPLIAIVSVSWFPIAISWLHREFVKNNLLACCLLVALIGWDLMIRFYGNFFITPLFLIRYFSPE